MLGTLTPRQTPGNGETHYYYEVNGRKFSVVDIIKVMEKSPLPERLKMDWYVEAMEIVDDKLITEGCWRENSVEELLKTLDLETK